MNEQPSHYDAVIADLRAKRDQIDQTIQTLEMLKTGVPLVLATAAASASFPAPVSNDSQIAPGTFHGMGIQEAVKKLLLIRKRTMNAPELATDLRSGGLNYTAKSIASVLHRNFVTGGDIVRQERGQWGLQEWYPNQRFNRSGEI